MQNLTFIAQLVLLVAYVIGACVVIRTLKTQNKSQSDMMDKMKQYADLFKVEEFKKYVEIKTDNIRMEQEKIRAKELEEQKKAIEEEWKKRANEGAGLLLKEVKALAQLSYKFVAESPENPKIDAYIAEMSEDTLSKKGLLEARQRVKTDWKSLLSDWSKKEPSWSPALMSVILSSMVNKK